MKLTLTEAQKNILERFVQSESQETKLIKNIIAFHLNELTDIMNIDDKGNMGLQAAARQQANNTLVGIFESIFPDIKEYSRTAESKREISPWR